MNICRLIDRSIDFFKGKSNEDFTAMENIEQIEQNSDNTTTPLTDVIPKVFYCFENTGCFKEREDYSLYLFTPDNK